ncbi:hypothetical protein D3C73_1064530 [compost metagenome]
MDKLISSGTREPKSRNAFTSAAPSRGMEAWASAISRIAVNRSRAYSSPKVTYPSQRPRYHFQRGSGRGSKACMIPCSASPAMEENELKIARNAMTKAPKKNPMVTMKAPFENLLIRSPPFAMPDPLSVPLLPTVFATNQNASRNTAVIIKVISITFFLSSSFQVIPSIILIPAPPCG